MEHHLKSEKNYRYYTQGDIRKAKKLLVVMHGYGYLAQYFIRKFVNLPEEYFVVAPEGMHRFYLNGVSGRVGASWMTKEDRESDIADNLHWLNELMQQFEGKHFEERILLGFSQGGATAARLYYHQESAFDHLVLWASVFPPDLDLATEIKAVENSKKTFVLGTEDEYFNTDQQQEILKFYKQKRFKIQTFDGGHDIQHEILLEVLS